MSRKWSKEPRRWTEWRGLFWSSKERITSQWADFMFDELMSWNLK